METQHLATFVAYWQADQYLHGAESDRAHYQAEKGTIWEG